MQNILDAKHQFRGNVEVPQPEVLTEFDSESSDSDSDTFTYFRSFHNESSSEDEDDDTPVFITALEED